MRELTDIVFSNRGCQEGSNLLQGLLVDYLLRFGVDCCFDDFDCWLLSLDLFELSGSK